MIEKTAIIHPTANIHEDVCIGPYSVIGQDVSIGSGTIIGSHVVIKGPTSIGSNNKICLLYTSPSPRDLSTSRMPSSA